MRATPPSRPVEDASLPLVSGSGEGPRDRRDALLAALSYVGFLGVIPLLVAQKSPFARFHARQGLSYALLSTVTGGVASGFAFLVPGLTGFGTGIRVILATIAIACIIRTLLGHSFALPIVDRIAREFPF